VKEYRREIARIEVTLKSPRPDVPDLAKLRAALEQRAEQWKAQLRAEPKIARMVLRRLVGPLVRRNSSLDPVSRVRGGPRYPSDNRATVIAPTFVDTRSRVVVGLPVAERLRRSAVGSSGRS
jgi:hypothetical protein